MTLATAPDREIAIVSFARDGRAKVLIWTLRLAASAILFQTLFFKFTAAPESVYIFSTLGLEPWGRIASGMAELVAGALLVIPRTVALGATLSLAIMIGAIGVHLTKLGVVVRDDGGLLFALALIVAGCSLVLLFLYRAELGKLMRRNSK